MARMKAGSSGIFTRDDYKTLMDARRTLNDLITTMDKAEACGVNCAVWRQQVADADQQLANIVQYFMTPVPA